MNLPADGRATAGCVAVANAVISPISAHASSADVYSTGAFSVAAFSGDAFSGDAFSADAFSTGAFSVARIPATVSASLH